MTIETNNKIELPITGMTCVACVAHVSRALEDVEGVKTAVVNLATERATVELGIRNKPMLEVLFNSIKDSGYGVSESQIILKVSGISNVDEIYSILDNLDYVTSVNIDPVSGQVSVNYISTLAGVNDLRESIENAGVLVTGVVSNIDSGSTSNGLRLLRYKFIFSLSTSFVMMLLMALDPPIPIDFNWIFLLIATPVQFWAGKQFYLGAWLGLKNRTSNMNTLIVVGTSVTYFYSLAVTIITATSLNNVVVMETYFDTSSTIIGLVLVGKYLELRAKGHALGAIKSLTGLKPESATVVRSGKETNVSVDDVVIGDEVIVRPGERVPVDGIVISGTSLVDESMMTGESVTVIKSKGYEVYGGTINTTGALSLETTRVGKDSFLSQIISLVEETQGSRAPIQRFADQVSMYFVPVVICASLMVGFTWLLLGPSPSYVYAILTAVSVLIISCPCALGLATPTAIMVGTGKGAEIGVLFRKSETLEIAQKIETVVFDKTGTLTGGNPEVFEVRAVDIDENELLRLAASVERLSEHPLGYAIVIEALSRELDIASVKNFQSLTGAGVEADIGRKKVVVGSNRLMEQRDYKSSGLTNIYDEPDSKYGRVYVAVDGNVVGVIKIGDSVKRYAREAVENLKAKDIEVILLTGDNRDTALNVAREVGIEEVIANVLPGQKAGHVRALQAGGKNVAMIGDGINDAPALAQSDVGVAIGTGTDLAMETADIILMSGDLRSICSLIELSKATMSTIRQNLFWAFSYNIALIPVAAGILYPLFSSVGVPDLLFPVFGNYGFLNPVLAAAAMAVSSVTVIGNSLLLRRFKA